jgi:hypothetical protein
MVELRLGAFIALAVGTFVCDALATDRFFADISAESPSRRYKVEDKSPVSLILKWNDRHVTNVERKTPALWKQGLVRDGQIID